MRAWLTFFSFGDILFSPEFNHSGAKDAMTLGNVAISKETRKGFKVIIKRGPVGADEVTPYTMEIDGIEIDVFSIAPRQGNIIQTLDQELYRWIDSGDFYGSVRNAELLSVFNQMQTDRLEEVPFFLKTFRFLQSRDYSFNNLAFIITTASNTLALPQGPV